MKLFAHSTHLALSLRFRAVVFVHLLSFSFLLRMMKRFQVSIVRLKYKHTHTHKQFNIRKDEREKVAEMMMVVVLLLFTREPQTIEATNIFKSNGKESYETID